MHDTRGYCGIALTYPDHDVNIDGTVRAAGCFDFDWVSVIHDGDMFANPYSPSAPTVGHHKHIPIRQIAGISKWDLTRPQEATVVRVDVDDDATPLDGYHHPERAIYWFGNESTGFDHIGGEKTDSEALRDAYTDDVVTIPSDYCCNLAVAVNIVAADRYEQTH